MPARALSDLFDKNQLLNALDERERNQILPRMTLEPLEPRNVLFEAGQPIQRVYFPISGMVSLVTVLSDGSAVEVAVVGREGVVGTVIFLSDSRWSNVRAIVQIRGDALSLPATDFRKIARRPGSLRDVMEKHTRALLAQMAQEAACNRLHSIEQRCARWLLMAQDRTGSDRFVVTQEFLALMLGTHRPSVTLAASSLQESGAIRYNRGRVTILNHDQLEAASCECYSVVRAERDRIFSQSA